MSKDYNHYYKKAGSDPYMNKLANIFDKYYNKKLDNVCRGSFNRRGLITELAVTIDEEVIKRKAKTFEPFVKLPFIGQLYRRIR